MSRRLQMAPAAPAEMNRVDVVAAERAAADLLIALGADLELEGLRETPRRVATAYPELLTPEPFDLTTFASLGCSHERLPGRSGRALAKLSCGRSVARGIAGSGANQMAEAIVGGCTLSAPSGTGDGLDPNPLPA